ncbi:MAG: hypothetical protein H7Y60_19075 [Rhodospirillaceae bacterium]|nr:hypothetical protein [Rhodospirillales bacterium]
MSEISSTPSAPPDLQTPYGASCSEIGGALAYYGDNLTQYLAAAVSEIDQLPIEVLNEVRGAFTHLAKAHKSGADTEDYKSEVNSAYRHLKRASLDCLKLAIMACAERVERRLNALNDNFVLPQEAYDRVAELRARRKLLLHSESSHPSHSTVGDLADLYGDFASFAVELDKRYHGPQAETLRRKQITRDRKSTWLSYLSGFVTSSVVSYIFWLFSK